MTLQVGASLDPDSLEANRSGRLAPKQRTSVGREERAWWKNELMGVVIFGVIGLLVLTSSAGTTPQTVRLAVGPWFVRDRRVLPR